MISIKKNKVLVQIGTCTGHSDHDPFEGIVKTTSPSKVILVEPNPALREEIYKNYEGVDNVFLESVAIVKEPTKELVRLVYPKNNKNGASINGIHYGPHNFSLVPMDDWGDDFEVLEVPGMTLNELCEKHKINHIHYLQIDAEGYDSEIIQSIDFSKVKIDIIKYEDWSFDESCFERHGEKAKLYGANGMKKAEAYLTSFDYLIMKDGKQDMLAVKGYYTLDHFEQKYLSDGSNPDGENKVHKEYASQAKDVIVEIGVHSGDTTKKLLNNSTCVVYGFDPMVEDVDYLCDLGDIEKIKALERRYSRFRFIQDYSYNIVKTWDKAIDYIFIDGDHHYDPAKQDFNDWLPHVKQGGIIAFHDSARNRGWAGWLGVSNFCDELLDDDRVEYVKTIHSLTVFKKR